MKLFQLVDACSMQVLWLVMDELDRDWMASQGPVEETATKAHCILSTTHLLVMLCNLQIEEKLPKW